MTIQDLKTKSLILFEVIFGNPATENSEIQMYGIYYLSKEDFFGQHHISQISNETDTATYYEIGRFIELLQKNDPKALEILASPKECILQKNPLIDLLKSENFLSKLCKDTFTDHVISQMKNVKGPNKVLLNPVEKEKKSILDFCFIIQTHSTVPLKEWLSKNRKLQQKCGLVTVDNTHGIFALFYDESEIAKYPGIIKTEKPNELHISPAPKEEEPIAYLFFNQGGYSTYCKDYREYWKWIADYREYSKWITERNENQSHQLHYDRENMMHTVRLLQSCQEIFKTGSLQNHIENHEELLNIKSGKISSETVIQKVEDLLQSIEYYYSISNLPNEPDLEKTTKVLIEIREKLYS